MNVGPVPRRSAPDCPARLGQDAASPPLVNGDAGHAEAVGDLSKAHGLAVVHEKDCIESLDGAPVRTDNPYMTNPRCTMIVRTGLPDVPCNRLAPYFVVVKAGGSQHVLPTCKTHIGRVVAGWLDVYGKGVTVTVEAGR